MHNRFTERKNTFRWKKNGKLIFLIPTFLHIKTSIIQTIAIRYNPNFNTRIEMKTKKKKKKEGRRDTKERKKERVSCDDELIRGWLP